MPTILGPQEMLPAKMEGPVISGFGRGSALLGFPTGFFFCLLFGSSGDSY